MQAVVCLNITKPVTVTSIDCQVPLSAGGPAAVGPEQAASSLLWMLDWQYAACGNAVASPAFLP